MVPIVFFKGGGVVNRVQGGEITPWSISDNETVNYTCLTKSFKTGVNHKVLSSCTMSSETTGQTAAMTTEEAATGSPGPAAVKGGRKVRRSELFIYKTLV